jgi:retron-type reverse transcriptase
MSKTKNPNNPSTTLKWEAIPKVKWKGLPQSEEIRNKISQTPIQPSTVFDILNKIYMKNARLKYKELFFEENKSGKLINLLADVDLLKVSANKTQKKKGSMTSGTAGSTADSLRESMLLEISKQIKNGTFRFSPTRKILIPKPGKDTKRPLGLPDFRDKIVQCAIDTVLKAIYEPQFEKEGMNFGFRPKKDCNGAIERCYTVLASTDYVVEGYIKGAYDNVNLEILMKLLRKRIKCSKTLNLIERLLHAGVMEDFQYTNSNVGVPQGGIVRPLFFNIYMSDFDLKLHLALKESQTEINAKIIAERKNVKSEVNPTYSKLRSIRRRTQARAEKLRVMPDINTIKYETLFDTLENTTFVEFEKYKPSTSQIEPFKQFREQTPSVKDVEIWRNYQRLRNTKNNTKIVHVADFTLEEQLSIENCHRQAHTKQKIKKFLKTNLTEEDQDLLVFLCLNKETKEIKNLWKELINTPYLDINRKLFTFKITRFADDFVVMIRGTYEHAKAVKEIVKTILTENLKLELSLEKTKITNPKKDKVNFLGFSLYINRNPKLTYVKEKKTTQRFWIPQIHPDTDRLTNRFILNKIILPDKNTGILKPRELGFLTTLSDHEIIEKYNQMMVGLGTYYIKNISYPSRIGYWHFQYYYSCIKTLATKHNITVKSIINSYGFFDISVPNRDTRKNNASATDKRICASYYKNNDKVWVRLLNYKEYMFRLLRTKNRLWEKTNGQSPLVQAVDFDNMKKINTRTKFKNSIVCSICSCDDPTQLESHHIKPIKHSGGKFTGYRAFDKLVGSLGRKQITVCIACHTKIHAGKYHGLSLSDLFDVVSVAPEGLFTFNRKKNDPKPNAKIEKKRYQPRYFEVNEDNKTYFNPAFNKFLKTHKHENNSQS